MVRGRQPGARNYASEQVRNEIDAAAELFRARGWLADPHTYHRTPPALSADEMTVRGSRFLPTKHELATFPSGFSPRSEEPGAARFGENKPNRTVWVRLLRHNDPDRPWVICLHGFGMGSSATDIHVMRANRLHHKFGYNVAVPVAPLHGPRNTPHGDQLMSLDLMKSLHAATQAVWDVRRLINWIRAGTDAPVGVFGISMGGYITAQLSGIEPVDCAVSGIAFVDMLGLLADHDPPAEFADIISSDAAHQVFRVASPLEFTPQAAGQDRAMFAAKYDQFIPQDQSVALQQAWSESPAFWAETGHVGSLMSRKTQRFVSDFVGARL